MRQRVGLVLTILWLTVAGHAIALTGPELANEFDRGLKAYDAKQYQVAFQIWWHIKDQDLAAMRNVALMLRNGQGVGKDPQKAESLLRTAAATGMPNAEVDLAEMYLNGETGSPDPKGAVPLLQDAAGAGHPLAEFLLGQMYEKGNAVPKDMSKATELYIAAAEGGLHDAKERLASLGQDQVRKPEAPLAAPAPPAVNPSSDERQYRAIGASKAKSGYVQLGSFKSSDAAEAQWQQLKRKLPLSSATHQVNKADLGQKGVWYRLVVPAQNHEAAIALCDQIKSASGICIVGIMHVSDN